MVCLPVIWARAGQHGRRESDAGLNASSERLTGRIPGAVAILGSVSKDEIAAAVEQIIIEGITARCQAFTIEWVAEMREDIEVAFAEASARPGGVVPRGPERYYVEIHPQQMRGFVDLMTHPWVTGVCTGVLGPDWKAVELGFDIPFDGAMGQPWHRDFPSPAETYEGRRLTSLAFNLTAVDTTEEMGPLEVALGTQWEPGLDFDNGMFPPREEAHRYEALAVRKYPKRGDVSARSALTIHRGTPNRSGTSRPVLVLGVDAPGAGHDALHDPMVTPEYWATLPDEVRRHVNCRVVDELVPIVQKHQIDRLIQPEY